MVPGSPQKIAPVWPSTGRAVERDALAVRLHRQLLQVGGEAVQVLVVGQHGDGLGAEEVAVPDAEQAHQRRQVALESAPRGSARRPRGSRPASSETPPGRSRASSRGRSPSPSSSGRRPSPRSRTCSRGRSRTRRRRRRWSRRRRSAVATASSRPPEAGQRPLAGGLGVGHRLQRRERLRGDDEQRLLRVEVAGGLGEVGAVDVGDEAEAEVALRVVAQRLVGHHRPEVGAADPDVDHVADRLAGMPAPLARAHPLGEGAHPVEHLVDLGDDVDAVDDQRALARHPQGDVEDRAVLGDVDPLAAEHRLASLGEAALARRAAPAVRASRR